MRCRRRPPTRDGRHGRARRGFLLLASVCAALLACARSGDPARTPLRIAAASDLTVAFGALLPLFEERTGERVEVVYGSSGQLAAQLEHGAPYDVLAAADGSYVDALIDARRCDSATRTVYGHGRLVLWTRAGAATSPQSLEELGDVRVRRVAIANPEHAPYGRAAREALTASGVWSAVAPRLVVAENVRQALQFGESGNVDVALVPWALVAEDRTHRWTLVPEELHAPLLQTAVACAQAEPQRARAAAFVRFLEDPAARAVLDRHGLRLPLPATSPDARGGGP